MQPLIIFFVDYLNYDGSSSRDILRMDILLALNWEKQGICQVMQEKATCFRRKQSVLQLPKKMVFSQWTQ